MIGQGKGVEPVGVVGRRARSYRAGASPVARAIRVDIAPMPRDIALSTNTATGALELRQAQPMPDGSGYAALLVVRSGGLAAALPFFATTEALRVFTHALGAVTAADAPPARLTARTGDDYIAIQGAGNDSIAVSGMLHEPEDQLLRFRFVTASAGLTAFLAGISALSEPP
jgi:hypothetical protein